MSSTISTLFHYVVFQHPFPVSSEHTLARITIYFVEAPRIETSCAVFNNAQLAFLLQFIQQGSVPLL